MKKAIFVLLKVGIPLLIIAWLLASVDREQLAALRQRSIEWPTLAAAFVAALVAVCLSFHRWYLLVKALEIPFRLRDGIRLGFLGYLFSFISVGTLGGDLFKAIFIAREQPGRRTLAVATVAVDRIIGLYALFLVTSAALLFTTFPADAGEQILILRNITHAATIIGGVGLLLVLSPGFTSGPLAEWAIALPRVGTFIERLISALRMYRRQPLVLVFILLESFGVHGMITLSVHLLASALYTDAPTLGEHFIIVPLSNLAGALPFTPGGLGTMEAAMGILYRLVPAHSAAPGIIVALGYRMITIAIAAVGVFVYWFSRREVAEIMHVQKGAGK